MFKNILEKFNKVMNFKSETFISQKIKDAEQSLEYSELVEGAEVLISTPTGSEVAPDGDYVLADGSEIKVADGKISEVVKQAAEEVEAEPAQELATDEDKKEKDAPVADESKEAELQAKIDELTAELEKLKAGFSAYPTKADLEKFSSDLTAELKKLENIPAQISKVDNRVELSDNPNAKYLAMAERFSK